MRTIHFIRAAVDKENILFRVLELTYPLDCFNNINSDKYV